MLRSGLGGRDMERRRREDVVHDEDGLCTDLMRDQAGRSTRLAERKVYGMQVMKGRHRDTNTDTG